MSELGFRQACAWLGGALMVLSTLVAQPTLAAEEAAGDKAVIVVIPEGLDPAERQQIIDEVLKGESATGGDAAQSETDTIKKFTEDLHRVSEAVEADITHLDRVPGLFATILARLTETGEPSDGLTTAVIGFLIIFGGGFLGECLLRFMFWRAPKATVEAVGESFTARMASSCGWLIREIVCLAVFLGLSAAIFYLFFDTTEPQRQAAATYWRAFMTIRVIMILTRFAVSPFKGAQRLIPLSDGDAKAVYWRLLILVTFIALAFYTQHLATDFAVGPRAVRAYGISAGVLTVLLEVLFVWQLRRPIGQLIIADIPAQTTPSPIRRTIAAQWHVYASVYFVAVFLIALFRAIIDGEVVAPQALATMGLVIVLPLAIRAIQLLLAERFQSVRARGGAASSIRANVGQALLKIVPIAMVLGALVLIGALWGVDLFNLTRTTAGAALLDAAIDICAILLIAYFLWELVKVTIDQRLKAEEPDLPEGESEGEGGSAGASRLSTLLPLIRTTFLITLVVIVFFVILSELGFNIGPLIAGAGVIGLAVGFGAQTLVTDVISGLFFLVDDAFRRGEYIDVGQAKGTVEKISIRSLQLRHQNGPVHTVPFSKIDTLTNYSRDWAIIKFEVRVPFETDINKVRKIVKNIGIEMTEDPELGPMMLAPLKSQGVNRMDDSALIIRCKFTAVPGKQFLVRREAFTRIQAAFAEQGVKFAPRRVVVDAHTPDAAAKAAAAVAEQEEAAAGAGAKPAAGPDG
ncbi:MAG: mechanosensitive ion channel domain-containing protein [Pseudomonadota bacterium]